MTKQQTFTGFAPADQPNPRALPVNTVLAGKYLVGKVLGQGGFGITYIGYDLNMQTKIAVKEYFPVELVHRNTTIAASDRAISLDVQSLGGEKIRIYQQGLEKYIAEARQVSKFADVPGVVSVKDFFYENQTAYIVMEYIDGISLKDYLKKKGGKLSEEETLFILKPVLKALESVHRAGIVHRDISPDNIMLTFEQEKIASVKLIDFGAARMTSTNDQKSLTIILKHGYAPEEQYRTHGDQGPWTDVYAICATMYRMLTGKTPESSMDRILTDQLPSIKEQGVVVSKNVEAAILAGLGVKKQDRIASIEELSSYLYEGKKVPSRYANASKRQKKGGGFAQTKSRRNIAIAAMATAAVLLLSAGGFWLFTSGQTNVPASEQQSVGQQDGQETAGMENSTLQEGQSQEILSGTEASSRLMLEDNEETDRIGPAIVKPAPQTSMAASQEHALIRREDGTVTALGKNHYGQCEVGDWKNIAAVAAGETFSAGLKEDGTVVIAGSMENAQDVARWENVIEISAYGYNLFGLTKEGRLLVNRPLGDPKEDPMEYLEWTDITHIAAGQYIIAALQRDGKILTAAEHKDPKYYGSLKTLEGWTDIEHLLIGQNALFGITTDGQVRYDLLFTDVSEDSYCFDGMDALNNVVQLYSEYGGSQYAVTTDGSLQYAGYLTYEGEGSELVFRPLREWSDLVGIVKVGQKFAALTKDGEILKMVENHGTTLPEDMTDLVWADYFPNAELLVGVTNAGKVLTYTPEWAPWELNGASNVAGIYPVLGEQRQSYLILEKNRQLHWGADADTMPPFSLQNIKQVVTSGTGTYLDGVYCAALLEGGSVQMYINPEDDYLSGLKVAEQWKDIRQIACDDQCFYGLCKDGSVQILFWDGTTIPNYGGIQDAASIYSGQSGIGVIHQDGTASLITGVLTDGAEEWLQNRYGQQNVEEWNNLTQLSLSKNHTVGLCADGTVVATGSNKNGQCQVSDWKDIIYVSAEDNATLGIRKDGKLLIAGTLGW